MKRLSIIASIFIIFPCYAFGDSFAESPVDFFKEEITLTVSDSSSNISGIYYFRNNTSKTGNFTVMFPFYVDSLSLFPDTIAAYYFENADTIPISIRQIPKQEMVVLNIPLKDRGITCWHLDYSQKILSSRAVYIITSTASWGKPLEDAKYRFLVPAKYKNISVWPEADTVINHDSYMEYYSHKVNFMPWRDMEIKWDYQ